MLVVNDIFVSYGNVEALRGTSLEVLDGEICTVIGANGAGKTTLLMTISGILHPTRGEIRFMGERIDNLPANEIVRRGIGHVPEGRRIFPDLTVEENLRVGAYLRGKDRAGVAQDRAWIHELFPILKERSKQLAGTLSGGEQQMLAIGRSLMTKPKLLLLDEPSMGLAPIVIQTIFRTLHEINSRGTTILLVEQNAKKALETAQHGNILEGGRVIYRDSCEVLRRDPRVRRAYVGEDIASTGITNGGSPGA
jgi:branched-chain amino acid transport system ATP-binding protein